MSLDTLIFMILRRMRVPLFMVVMSYAICVLGFVLIPAMDANGQPYQLDFFHAFYIVSYTATTIGFGEIPTAFTIAQRLWMTFTIYLTVICWFYSIGAIISLFQDPALKTAFLATRFRWQAKHLHEPFYIVCGYGETGSELVRALDKNEMRVVVIEHNNDRITELDMADLQLTVPNFCGDAKLPENLFNAGLTNPMCQGVAAMTNDEQANLAIAVAVKLIKPELKVLARVHTQVTAKNMASFGTDHILNPYTIFGDHLAMEVHALGTYLLHVWLTGVPGDTVTPPQAPPHGHWVVCGYGRFGKAVVENLQREHMPVTIVEADPVGTKCPVCVVGSGVEADTLNEAGIKHAVGIVAGTDNDISNLSIVMTALEENPNLFVVIRKNRHHNDPLFEHFAADITMQPSKIIAHACLSYMLHPLLTEFLLMSRQQDNAWANSVIARMVSIMGEQVPDSWGVEISPSGAAAVLQLLNEQQAIKLEHIMLKPNTGDEYLPLMPLLLLRGQQKILMPEADTPLQTGDRILFCGRDQAKSTQRFMVQDLYSMEFLVRGAKIPNSSIGRLFRRNHSANNQAAPYEQEISTRKAPDA